ncbi:heterokaryon incompatibility, partial [Podospora fimiseda]
LDHNPIFEALSYVWGDPTPIDTIVIDDIPIKIPRELQILLPYITYRIKTCQIWIDAMCINQTDDAEKGAQIAMMGRIYSQARNILSWLG